MYKYFKWYNIFARKDGDSVSEARCIVGCVSGFSTPGEGALRKGFGGAEPLQPTLHGGHGAGV